MRWTNARVALNCWCCGEYIAPGEQVWLDGNSNAYAVDCAYLQGDYVTEAPDDTASLQDSDPNGHEYLTNANGYGY